MAYSNVGTPVFYVDNYLYRKTIGVETHTTDTSEQGVYSDKTHPNLVNISPSFSSTLIGFIDNPFAMEFHIPARNLSDNTSTYFPNFDLSGNMKIYCAVLNHNLNIIKFGGDSANADSYISLDSNTTAVLNWDYSNQNANDGSTIVTIDSLIGNSKDNLRIRGTVNYNNEVSPIVGCISTGIQYTMPHSPDLDLSMDIEFDGVSTITTSGGKSLTNIKYVGNPLWVNGNRKTNPFDVIPFQYQDDSGLTHVDVSKTGERRNGRKSWNLKFTYLSDSNLFASNQGATVYTQTLDSDGSIYESDDYNSTDTIMNHNIDTDDSFYAQVWNKTLGGALPFIFQPDSNNNDDFYICKFDSKSLIAKQSAYKVYDVSLKIKEVC